MRDATNTHNSRPTARLSETRIRRGANATPFAHEGFASSELLLPIRIVKVGCAVAATLDPLSDQASSTQPSEPLLAGQQERA
jgi:hypothetical protein